MVLGVCDRYDAVDGGDRRFGFWGDLMENENHTKDWRELIGKLDRGDINSLSEEDKLFVIESVPFLIYMGAKHIYEQECKACPEDKDTFELDYAVNVAIENFVSHLLEKTLGIELLEVANPEFDVVH